MLRRPINLNLLTIHFPIPAIISIAHRLSGLFLVFLIPLLLFTLQESLHSSSRFTELKLTLSQPLLQITLWIFLAALIFHLIAGIRHLLMDMHFGDSLRAGRFSAWLTVLIAAGFIIAGGFWLW